MKSAVFASVLAIAAMMAAGPAANAKGCIKGAIVGGIAGHFAHHGWLGAGAGCAVGHHMAAKKNETAHPDTNTTNQKGD